MIKLKAPEGYTCDGMLGAGAFGTVWRVRKKGQLYACKSVKYLSMSLQHKEQLVAEVNIMRELRHPHIVRYVDRSIDKSTGTLHIVMEYCPGGDLAQRIAARTKKFGTEFLWQLVKEVASALRDCHSGRFGRVVLHRDLKPANILFDSDGHVKVADFGLAKELKNTDLAKSHLGTPLYMAPEVVRKEPYGSSADMWSLGCILYEAAALEPPFQQRSEQALEFAIVTCHTKPLAANKRICDLVASLMTVNAAKRPDAKHVCALAERALLGDDRVADLDARERRLDEREKQLNERERLLDKRQSSLDERQRAFDNKENSLLFPQKKQRRLV